MNVSCPNRLTPVARAVSGIHAPFFSGSLKALLLCSALGLGLGIENSWSASWPTPTAVSTTVDLTNAVTALNAAINACATGNCGGLAAAQAAYRAALAAANPSAVLLVTSDDSIAPPKLSIAASNAASIQASDGAGLTIENFSIVGNGGAISLAGNSVLDISASAGGRIIFRNNEASLGGAIINSGGTLSIADSEFSSNTATSSGGAIYNASSGTLNIMSSEFSNNTSTSSGGAVYNSGSTLSIISSEFSDNRATTNGGVIINLNGTASISISGFSDNSANNGGAIFNQNGTLNIMSSGFSSNSVTARGGAIYNTTNGTLSITASELSNNSAAADGGAIFNVTSGTLSILSSGLSGNNATFGGAIYNNGGLSITASEFSNNSAVANGGAISNVPNATLSILSSGLSGNNATFGGAINNNGGLSIISSEFSGNSANVGGAIANIFNGAIASITNSNFIGNSASSNGGAINNQAGTTNLTDSNFFNNTAGVNGGAIYVTAVSGIENSSIINLSVTSGGSSTFSGNRASGQASSITFNALASSQIFQLNVDVAANGILDMQDPIGREGTGGQGAVVITQTGTGLWKLGGTNDFAAEGDGHTIFSVNSGTLYLYGTGGSVTAGEITLAGADSDFSLGTGAILASGGINRINSEGTITLSGGSTLRGDSAASELTLTAAGGVTLSGNVTVNAAQGNQLTLHGALNGTNGLSKTGDGLVTLTGNSSGLSGETQVMAGSLEVNGILGGSMLVQPQGRLQGTGAVGSTTVFGTIAPGHLISTLTINGDYIQQPGSTYAVEVDAAGHSDLINVTGTATLNGGLVQVIDGPGSYVADSQYTILSALGGVSGTFAPFTDNLLFLSFGLHYDSNNVYLRVNRNSTSFADVAQTPNERGAATGAESLGAGNVVYDAIANLSSVSEAREAFNALSGEGYASAMGVMVEASRYVREAMLSRLQQTLGDDSSRHHFSWNPLQSLHEQGWTSWAQGYGAWGDFSSDGNAASVARTNRGVFLGADRAVGDGRVGILGGYSHNEFTTQSSCNTRGNADNYNVGLYGGGTVHGWSLRAGGTYSWSDWGMNRVVRFADFANELTSHFNATTGQVFAEGGYPFRWQRATMEPFAGVAYVQVDTDRWTEQGGASALMGSGSQGVVYSALGAREEVRIYEGTHVNVDEYLNLSWRHAYTDVVPQTLLQFASGSTPFMIFGAPIAKNALMVDAGLRWQNPEKTLSARLGYTGQIAYQAQDHALMGKIAWLAD